NTLPGRLQWAIAEQPRQGRQRGLRLFQRRMEERAAQVEAEGGPPLAGTHLASIQGYISGKVEPSLRFLEEAARVLGVRPAWLAYNDGPPREAERVAGALGYLEKALPADTVSRAHAIWQ